MPMINPNSTFIYTSLADRGIIEVLKTV